MKEGFYFDTSIWLDFYEKRDKRGEVALKLINKIISENKVILYSDIILRELKKLGYFDNDISDILSIAKPDNVRKVHVFKEQINEAEKIALKRNLPKRDVLHAILARDNESHMITRDYHFQKIRDIIIPSLPEEFI